jgi:succinoglycan biosynthesis protein ExoM
MTSSFHQPSTKNPADPSTQRLAMTQDHISVCICTYKRPEMLAHALEGIGSQVSNGDFTFEVVVVDNDRMRSAEAVVESFQAKTELTIVYDCEPEQNISLARNRAIRNASGNFIAFIDDDEVPVNDWLYGLFRIIKDFGADGVLGPVLPFYPAGAPRWLKKGNVLHRHRLGTGTRLTVRDTRTGNVLLSRAVFEEGDVWFDPAFGRTGQEDKDFFRRQLARERAFIWCDEAVAYETVPPERWQIAFHIKKFWRGGTLNGEHLRRSGSAGLRVVVKRVLSVPVWLIGLLFALPFGKHVWIRPAMKLAYCSGCVLAYCGFSLMRYRD